MKAKHLLFLGWLILGVSASAGAGAAERNVEPYTVKNADCAAAYDKFRRAYLPIFFAVSDDSKLCVYSYCGRACRVTNARSMTGYRCEKESGTSCRVYGPNDPIPGISTN